MDEVFDRLRDIMRRSSKQLVVVSDEPGSVSIESDDVKANGKRRWFGGVQTKKNYVSYHLMPVYEHPELLDDISPELRARMQGKSCFNFKKVDDEIFEQLEVLTQRSVADFEQNPEPS
jgi:hypothetical protein